MDAHQLLYHFHHCIFCQFCCVRWEILGIAPSQILLGYDIVCQSYGALYLSWSIAGELIKLYLEELQISFINVST